MITSTFHFAYTWFLYAGAILLCSALWYRVYRHKKPMYVFPLTHLFVENRPRINRLFIQNIIRSIILIGLVLLIARPQKIDEQSKVMVEGIDIMLVLDVSLSMQCFDDLRNEKSRLVIAQEEAINFIKKRDNDPIGLVLFGNQAVSRCPVTLDKNVLEDIIKHYELGEIDGTGTVLTQGIVTALNRLRKSEAKTKIIIMLTDGMPSENDLPYQYAISLAQKYGVKIYTIGIGGMEGGFIRHPQTGQIHQAGTGLNRELLEVLAKETGGRAFLATNQKDLQTIYDTIDTLEKKEYETDVYKKYYDIFMPFLLILFILMIAEFVVITVVWCVI
jgi:Ca-activated chloride channel family protein